MTTNVYQPTSRRPIAAMFRRTADRAVLICLRLGVCADAVSYSSIVVSAAAGICFWQSRHWPFLLLVAPLLCFVRLWFNMLDGMVALAAHTASRRGEILNDLPDRVSDVLIFAGVAHSGWCAVLLPYWAAIFALFTAYVGTLGQAVGARREYGGVMSKPWRMVVLAAGAWISFASIEIRHGNVRWGPLAILDWTCLLIIAGCVQTITVRLRKILATLDAQGSRQSVDSPGSH